MRPRSCLILLPLLLALCASACSSTAGEPDASEQSDRQGDARPVVLDYSPTLSDIPALLYLATHPEVELFAVTLAGTGESDCEPGVLHTMALLELAGHDEIPVACGSELPMAGTRDWPAEWRASANQVGGLVLPGGQTLPDFGAEELLTSVIGESANPVTIVTLAPLTNIGRVLHSEPGLGDNIDSIFVMGGAFGVPGNVDGSQAAEWNLHIDPEAARAVLESGVPVTFVGLDATNQVPGNSRIAARLAATTATAAGDALQKLWLANLDAISSEGWYFWDELAVVVATDPGGFEIEASRVSIDEEGATITGADGHSVNVVRGADPGTFENLFLEVFAGGELAPLEPLAPTEAEYFAGIGLAFDNFGSSLEQAFSQLEPEPESSDPTAPMIEFGESIFAGIKGLAAELAALDPPSDALPEHQHLVDLVATIEAAAPQFLSSMENAEGDTDFWEALDVAATESGISEAIDGLGPACLQIQLNGEGRGASLTGLCRSLSD